MFEHFMPFRFTFFCFLEDSLETLGKVVLERLWWLHEFSRYVWKKYIMGVMKFISLIVRERKGS